MAIDGFGKVVQTSALSGANGGAALTQYVSGWSFWASAAAEVKIHDSVDNTGPVIYHWISAAGTSDATSPTFLLNPVRLINKNCFIEVVAGGAANTPEVTVYGK